MASVAEARPELERVASWIRRAQRRLCSGQYGGARAILEAADRHLDMLSLRLGYAPDDARNPCACLYLRTRAEWEHIERLNYHLPAAPARPDRPRGTGPGR